jgi:hypothetical protein
VVIESYLVYVTLVALPAYAQYVITPALIVGFLVAGNWHRAAVVLVSLAYLWDQFFIVYFPQKPLGWESGFHQASHVLIILIVLAYGIHRFLVTGRKFIHEKQIPS